MVSIRRTDSSHPDFVALVAQLDNYLSIVNGEEDKFYAQYNKIDALKHVVIAYQNGIAVGCGAIKEIGAGVMEVKRMFTLPDMRGKGVASSVLKALESWAAELGYSSCMLETGTMLPDAIALYEKKGYVRIPNYGQYVGMPRSVCFEKKL